jgi:hypothetical protein
LIGSVEKEGFETKIVIADADEKYCVFTVMPVDKEGRETRYSNSALVRECDEWLIFTPMMWREWMREHPRGSSSRI